MNAEKLMIETRIGLLMERSPVESANIIKKLQRKLRKIKEIEESNS